MSPLLETDHWDSSGMPAGFGLLSIVPSFASPSAGVLSVPPVKLSCAVSRVYVVLAESWESLSEVSLSFKGNKLTLLVVSSKVNIAVAKITTAMAIRTVFLLGFFIFVFYQKLICLF